MEMKMIHPAEISGKIMTLIDQAKHEIIIVSPYNKFTYWKKLTKRINKAKERGVIIKWYIRKNIENNVVQIKKLGITPIEVENLHCKLYLNEQHAIVTSMNLHEYSDSSSIDIGYLITDETKYKEIKEFINVYIDNHFTDMPVMEAQTEKSFYELIYYFLASRESDFKEIDQSMNRYGQVVSALGFMGNFELIFEPKGSYYRIDLRIRYPYKTKDKIFTILKAKEDELKETIGHEIKYGTQMKRLKIDLDLFDDYDYESWGYQEFKKLEPYLTRAYNTYKRIIQNELIKYR
ncbi:MAG: hypothetical protein K9I47_10480 [Bacteroidales bacterium]|nr:hypothetical protein [Bacteroidales bacterium]